MFHRANYGMRTAATLHTVKLPTTTRIYMTHTPGHAEDRCASLGWQRQHNTAMCLLDLPAPASAAVAARIPLQLWV